MPETVAAATERFIFPLLLSVTVCVLLCPTDTLLKFSDVGENPARASKPVPLSVILRDEFEASLVTVSVPDAGVIDVGANCTCTVALCPTGRELEGFPPTTVNTPPAIVAPEIFTMPVPVFITVTFCVAVLPTATFPKLMLADEPVSTPPPELPVPPLPVDPAALL